jgi:hypothetical protein
MAKHARELAQPIPRNAFRNATDVEASYQISIFSASFRAMLCALDPNYDRCGAFPKNLPQPPRGTVSQFTSALKRLSFNLEIIARDPPRGGVKLSLLNGKTAKPVEKADRFNYFRFLLEIFLHSGGKLKLGRGIQLSGFENFVVSVTEMIPRQAVRKYFDDGLDRALRDWIPTEGILFISGGGSRRLLRSQVALQLRITTEIPC